MTGSTGSNKESIKVAFVGTEGIYAETAAKLAFDKDDDITTLSYADLGKLDYGLSSKEITHGMVSIENSLSGTFNSALDFLIRRPNTHIISEVLIKENNVLLAHEETTIGDVKEIIASPQSIDQCRAHVLKLLEGRDATFKIVSDLKEWARKINRGELKGTALISDPELFTSTQLRSISRPLGDYPEHNYTRFFIIATKPALPEKHQLPKTTIAVTLKNTPGALMKVFSVFALRDLNVCKVESRASARSVGIGSAWEYTIVMDVDGAPHIDRHLQNALNNLQEFATKVQVLGTYPRYFPPPTVNLAPVGL